MKIYNVNQYYIFSLGIIMFNNNRYSRYIYINHLQYTYKVIVQLFLYFSHPYSHFTLTESPHLKSHLLSCQDINAMTPCKKEKKVSKKSSATPTTAGGKDSSAKDCVDGTTSSPEHASNDTYEDDWCDDTSAEAVAARQQSLSSAAKNITISDDVDKPISQRINLFYVFVKVLLLYIMYLYLSLFFLSISLSLHIHTNTHHIYIYINIFE